MAIKELQTQFVEIPEGSPFLFKKSGDDGADVVFAGPMSKTEADSDFRRKQSTHTQNIQLYSRLEANQDLQALTISEGVNEKAYNFIRSYIPDLGRLVRVHDHTDKESYSYVYTTQDTEIRQSFYTLDEWQRQIDEVYAIADQSILKART